MRQTLHSGESEGPAGAFNVSPQRVHTVAL
jgi:hypothetical protein